MEMRGSDVIVGEWETGGTSGPSSAAHRARRPDGIRVRPRARDGARNATLPRETRGLVYVLEGELEFRIDGRIVRAKRGSIVVAPRGAVHAFPVAVDGPARFLNLHTPGVGFEQYLRDFNAMRARGERPSAEFLRSYDIYEV